MHGLPSLIFHTSRKHTIPCYKDGNPKNSYLYFLTLPSFSVLLVSPMCFLPNLPYPDFSYSNFRNKKYISEIPASFNGGIAWMSTGNNDEIWNFRIWKYWRVTRRSQELNKSNLERQWVTFVYGFLPEGILQSWVKDPNRRGQQNNQKLEGKIQFKKLLYMWRNRKIQHTQRGKSQ